MKIINIISDTVFKIEKVLAILLAGGLLVALAGGVFYRYILKSPLFWSDELALFCLVWITFIGGSMGLKLNASPSITIIKDRLSTTGKKVLNLISNIVLLIFVGYLLYIALQWISMPTIKFQTSTAMNMPKIYFYLSIPVSFAFMVIHVINNIFLSFKDVDEEGSLQ